jgi:hypothetical protein
MPRSVYRLVYHDPPTGDDFLPDEETGAGPAPHETAEDRTGMSVWGKLREARGWAKWQVRTGKRAYVGIAEILVEEGGPSASGTVLRRGIIAPCGAIGMRWPRLLGSSNDTPSRLEAAMKYAIWRDDLPAGAATFDTEDAALDAVRAALRAHGADFVVGWSLVRVPKHGDLTSLAEGTDLVGRAMASQSPGGRAPNRVRARPQPERRAGARLRRPPVDPRLG